MLVLRWFVGGCDVGSLHRRRFADTGHATTNKPAFTSSNMRSDEWKVGPEIHFLEASSADSPFATTGKGVDSMYALAGQTCFDHKIMGTILMVITSWCAC